MADETSNGSRGGGAGSKADPPRGPRFPRSIFLVLLVGLLLVAIYRLASEPNQFEAITFHKFQKEFWDEKAGRYRKLLAGKLREDLLLVKPEDQTGGKTEAAKNPLTGKPTELWYTVRLPLTAIDGDLLRRFGTIEGFQVDNSNTALKWLVFMTFPLVVLMVLFYLMVIRPLRGHGGAGNVLAFGRSRPKLISKETTGVRFEDVAGIDEAKEEVREVIEFLRNPEKFAKLGGRIPRGLLFVGPPGAGKTLLAKAISGEAEVPFYSISGSDFVEMFVGVGASRVRDLFRQAKEHAPCIIFLDEVDAVGRRRGSGLGGGHDEREQTLNAILVEMDGFDTNEQVIVIAATNRPDVLDPALLRPGRFDREVVIDLPDIKGREQILKVHARRVKMSDDVDLQKVARGTSMFSGAELEAVINEAAIRATMAGKALIEQADLEEARDKVRFGREKRSRVVADHERRVIAYHEAGHAILVRQTAEVEPLHKVTIIPRGVMGGATMSLPTHDSILVSRKYLLGQIRVLYGGRIAEQMFFGDFSAGAANDIDRASSLARRMVCDFGMSDDLGPIKYSVKEQQIYLGGEITQPREFSEATAERIDKAVRQIIDRCYKEAEELLAKHRHEVDLLARSLLKHETLQATEVEEILSSGNIDSIVKPSLNGQATAATATPAEATGDTTPSC